MKAELLKRGAICLVDWSPGRGSEQEGVRPALIVQVDAANQNPKYSNVIVVTISTKGRPVPFHIPVSPFPLNGFLFLILSRSQGTVFHHFLLPKSPLVVRSRRFNHYLEE